jgi:HEAT repeat protein
MQRVIAGANGKVSRPSGRSTRRVEEPEPPPESRRSARRTVRDTEAAPLLGKKQIILGSAGVVVLLTLIIGYGPFMNYRLTKTLDEAPSVGERKNAAEGLFHRNGLGALQTFAMRVERPDPMVREAATHGLELIGTKTSAYPTVIEKFKDILPKAEPETKLLYIRALNNIAAKLTDTRGEGKTSPNDERPKAIKTIAQTLIPCSEPAEQSQDVRALAVEGLVQLQTAGVCRQLIKLAATEKTALRDKARNGISATALPEAAGELLKSMTSSDKELAAVCKQAFVRIRDEAPSAELLPLVTHELEDVRREIVEALSKRQGDDKAREGIGKALKDKSAAIRILAVKAVPTTGIQGSMEPLAAVARDENEAVRIATAETLGQLRDPETKKILLEAFKNNPQGETMKAYITALGKRSSGKVLSEIAIVMGVLDTNPAAEGAICEALVLLTSNGVGGRTEQRRGWKAAQWKAWYAKITAREKAKDGAISEIEKIKAQAKQMNRGTFKALKELLERQLEVLEQCQKQCLPDDAEDVAAFERMQADYSKVKDLLFRHASLDVRGGD